MTTSTYPKRIELTIETSNTKGGGYCPDWDRLWHGVREIMNNARDAEMVRGAKMMVVWADGWLCIRNAGTTLSLENLLLGNSDKRDEQKAIGQHGDGMKTGILALLRLGYAVAIRTGGEVWTPAIERSTVFDAEVLVFHITEAPRFSDRVVVEIKCDRNEWADLRENFLYLGRVTENDRIETPHGTLLLADRFSGRLYVKGVYVQTVVGLGYGYDLVDAKLNRDRNIVDQYDRERGMRSIWNTALGEDRDGLLGIYYKLLAQDKPDVGGMVYHAGSLNADTKDAIAKQFRAKHGADAVAVENISQSRELAHLGKKGVVVTPALRAVVEEVLGNVTDIRDGLLLETKKTYSWDELKGIEQKNLLRALELVQYARPELQLSSIDIVDFRSESLDGQHHGGRNLLARRVLSSRKQAVATLVHEVAHDKGIDGQKEHVSAIEDIWSTITEGLLNSQ